MHKKLASLDKFQLKIQFSPFSHSFATNANRRSRSRHFFFAQRSPHVFSLPFSLGIRFNFYVFTYIRFVWSIPNNYHIRFRICSHVLDVERLETLKRRRRRFVDDNFDRPYWFRSRSFVCVHIWVNATTTVGRFAVSFCSVFSFFLSH